MIDIFLGGTCNGSEWREQLKPWLDAVGITYFDPVVNDWSQADRDRKIAARKDSRFSLYAITPEMTGVYSIAEAIDDVHHKPTIFAVLDKEGFTDGQRRSLDAVGAMIAYHNGYYTHGDVRQLLRVILDVVPLKEGEA